jgi:hypothetical protein
VPTADLATALNNIVEDLQLIGRPDEALAAAREAVRIRRDLTGQDPRTYAPQLASALSNEAGVLVSQDDPASALGPAEEAATLYRRLSAERPTPTGGRWPRL